LTSFNIFWGDGQQEFVSGIGQFIIGDYWYEFRLIVYDAEKTIYSTDLEKGSAINSHINTVGAWHSVVHWATLE